MAKKLDDVPALRQTKHFTGRTTLTDQVHLTLHHPAPGSSLPHPPPAAAASRHHKLLQGIQTLTDGNVSGSQVSPTNEVSGGRIIERLDRDLPVYWR
ncbi:hypothetical protein JOB18_036134 [Solea senegalensis]|uniref:Uncharacterized protein n=1 Tax=Solea senegalensis TaxID=28829 RepID=A0AAV6REG1_SOLSE|nr:hypothetical protein JOB18_036134 [Solea senegalensis]